ncbi:hypothetical protein KIH23_00005, partial [Flavobacterium sp. CYK-55]|nr:hypothetical protein [Flavobacterium sp. CYK-55]
MKRKLHRDFTALPHYFINPFFFILFLVLSTFGLRAQSPVYFSSGNYNPPNNWNQNAASLMSTVAGTNIAIVSPNGSGNQYFRFYSALSGGTNFSPNSTTTDILLAANSISTLQTNTGGGGKAYYMNLANPFSATRVVFKTVGSGTSARVAAFEIQGPLRSISSASRNITTPNQSQAVTVTANLDGSLSTGQGVWLRYTTDSYASSTVVQMTGSGTVYTANIPAQAVGANVSYYLFTSGTPASITGADADLMTINLNNNSGANYTYTVVSAPVAPAQPSVISGNAVVCNGSSQTYSVTNDTNATSYVWTLPSGWIGSSSTNSITVTASSTGGTISVVAQNAQGDSPSRSLSVSIAAATSISAQPSTSAQNICLGTSATALSITANGSSLTYQWYRNTSASNTGGTLISGATSNSYTPTYTGSTVYYYCVVGGACAPTIVTSDVSGPITIGGFPNDTATYTISNGGNGGQGFGAWAYSVTGSGGTFTGGSDIGTAWGLYANSGGVTTANRPFAAELSIGQTVSMGFDNGSVDTGNKVGFRLRNANNNVLMEFRFIGGATQYSLYDGVGSTVNDTGVNFTTAGLSNITLAYTAANTYAISITRLGVTTVLNGRSFATTAGSQIPASIEFFNSNAGNGSTNDFFFNNLTVGYPKIFTQPATSAQSICLNGSSTALSVAAYGNNLGYQWYSNPGAVMISGANASSYSPPTNVVGVNSYYCVVSYTGSCGSASSLTSADSGTITVKALPTASISASSTSACLNGASAQIIFNGADGTAPYTFTYKINSGSNQTITTTSGNSVSVSVPTSTLGSFTYELVSVQDAATPSCSNAQTGSVTVTVSNPTTFYADADGDTYGDINHPLQSCDGLPPMYAGYPAVTDTTDCNDNDALKHGLFSFYIDQDGDGFGTGVLTEVCAQDEFTPPANYATNNTDCNDSDVNYYQTYPFYADADGDGYGAGSLVSVCAMFDFLPPNNYSLNNTDCDDTNALKYTTFAFYVDADGDGYGSTTTDLACAVDANTAPSGYSTNDQDCDDADATKYTTFAFYVDGDGDGYGSGTAEMLCAANASAAPVGYSADNTDCDDADNLKHTTFLFYVDADADGYGTGTPGQACGENGTTAPEGYSLVGGDCDDTDSAIYRNDPYYYDTDGDGYDAGAVSGVVCYGALPPNTSLTTLGSDCDDSDNSKFQSAPLYTDVDGDGYTLVGAVPTCYGATLPTGTSLTSLGIDCDDNNSAVYQAVSLYVDEDGDTFTAGNSSISCIGAVQPAGTTYINNPTDCDDQDPTKHASFYFHNDLDGDGIGTGIVSFVCAVDQQTPPAGYSNDNSDCDDTDSTIYRSALLYTDLDGDLYTVGAGSVVCYGATQPAGTSLTSLGEDCDDNNIAVYQTASVYVDVDGDGYTVGSILNLCYGATLPSGYAYNASGAEDCNDNNAAVYQSNLLYTDADADGYDAGSATICYGSILPIGTSLSTLGSDCDDANSLLYQATTLYADADADGFGTSTATLVCAPVNCASSSTIAVTFRVNMSAETVESGGVHVAGNFATRGSTSLPTDWSPSAAGSQFKSVGNNIYELTVLFPASAVGQQLQYKFLRNNTWNSGATQYSEQNISSTCGTNDGGGNFNRSLVLPSQYALIETAYDQCPTSSVNYLCDNTDCNDSNASVHASYEFYTDADHDNYGTGSPVVVCALNAVSPPLGYSVNATDCDDNNILVYRTGDLYLDADGDGYTVGAAMTMCYGTSVPAGYSATSLGEDCNDNNATVFQSGFFYVDADNDGYTVGSLVEVCYGAAAPLGYNAFTNGEDCDDADATKYQTAMLYVDADGDAFTVGATMSVCYGISIPSGFSFISNGEDCDDADATKYQTAMLYVDADGDGYTVGAATSVCYGATIPTGYSATSAGEDCDDNNAEVTVGSTFYADADGDGFGNAAVSTTACTAPSGYVSNNTDCDDTNMSIYQLATYYVDADGDGWDNGTASVCSGTSAPAGYSATTSGTDCDDTNPL